MARTREYSTLPGEGGGGGQFFPGGGVQMLISIVTHITCDFQGGRVLTPYPSSGSAYATTVESTQLH